MESLPIEKPDDFEVKTNYVVENQEKIEEQKRNKEATHNQLNDLEYSLRDTP